MPMRLPHFLTLAPSGFFHFRLRVPLAHRDALGREVRASLRTRDRRTAQLVAQVLAQRYASAFGRGEAAMSHADDLIAEALRALGNGQMRERVRLNLPVIEIEANNAEESALAASLLREARAVYTPPPPAAVSASPAQPAASRETLGRAAERWSKTLDGITMPAKTRSIKRCAVRELVEIVGAGISCGEITRADVGRWAEALRGRGLATPTICNKAGYISGFFNWLKASGIISGENPATGVVSYGIREKRGRRKSGFQAFTAAMVAALFAPQSLAKLSPAARWGALLGLYTGARVSEIAQARVNDFAEMDEVLCLTITDEGEGQSLKNDGSRRVVPLHPDLLEMGLRARLDALRAAGETRFFPGHKLAATINGPGQWLSKAWSYYLKAQGTTCPPPGRLGFHSLRKTVTQMLQNAGVSAEVRAALLGHELDDEHHAAYSRGATIAEQYDALKKGMRYGLALDRLRALLF